MKGYKDISRLTVERMALYLRETYYFQNEGLDVISSEILGYRLNIKPGQIRKDLALFGEFGKKGVGYPVRNLQKNIAKILSLHVNWNIALVGLGHLGWSLAKYLNFSGVGLKLGAIFDNDDAKIGKKINGIPISNVESLEELIRQHNIHIGIITVPAGAAQQIADKMVCAGARAIWNFAPVRLKVPDNITIITEDFAVSLCSLAYFLSQADYSGKYMGNIGYRGSSGLADER